MKEIYPNGRPGEPSGTQGGSQDSDMAELQKLMGEMPPELGNLMNGLFSELGGNK